MNSNMTPVDWAKRPIQKYADFSGRASRSEYWWYVLAIVAASVVLTIFESVLGIQRMIAGVYGPLMLLLFLATIVPSVAVAVRRLHDTNRSGWWLLLPVIPYAIAVALGGAAISGGAGMAGLGIAGLFLFVGFICAIVVLIFYCLSGTPGDNRFGPNPLGAEGAAATI